MDVRYIVDMDALKSSPEEAFPKGCLEVKQQIKCHTDADFF